MTDPGYVLLARDGEPVGQGRPRFVRSTGHAHTPDGTRSAAQEWKALWYEAGAPRLDGPLSLTVVARHTRPRGHWRRDGSLSAAGERSARPTKRPDLSNIIKLIEDALNGLAYPDDAQIVEYQACRKEWAKADVPPQTVVLIRPWDPRTQTFDPGDGTPRGGGPRLMTGTGRGAATSAPTRLAAVHAGDS